MKERLMENMTVKDVIEAQKETKTVLLPIGGTEQHGWHLPLSTDAIIAYFLAKEASNITGCLVAPVLKYSHSYGTLPGTTNISPDTLRRMVTEICESLIGQGFENVILVLGHGEPSTIHAVEDAVSSLGKKKEGKVILYGEDSPPPPEEKKEVTEEEPDGHAGTGETSAVMYVRPDLVKEEKPFDPKERWWINTVIGIHQAGVWWKGDRMKKLSHVPWEEVMMRIKEAEKKFFPVKYGIFGDPTKATKQKGRIYLEQKVKALADFIRKVDSGL